MTTRIVKWVWIIQTSNAGVVKTGEDDALVPYGIWKTKRDAETYLKYYDLLGGKRLPSPTITRVKITIEELL